MSRNTLSILIVAFALAGCASTPAIRPGEFAWDGLGRDPNHPAAVTRPHVKEKTVLASDPNSQREKVLATLRPYSAAWWAVHDEIEAENDRLIRSKLVICRGCLERASAQDITGSIP
ncbi:hypothetical protein JQ615_12345 [Bradyrhizobium jicamae]|uniref:Uncharacterized protein n=1 Tax=Bradyrhizobium jicamae TaxID=280332 RepID=A0ABS5FHN3_9BRAD|nr:hypothetical protein [Bradyrhizobium jicamae]MBR0796179.1 hypothetical protein [Bradyrhizobium jicamae]MBR0937729.1 hypothetical protein [Bradyrhizobium jicamae]